MKVTVNGEPVEVVDAQILLSVLKTTGHDKLKGIAVALNNQVVRKTDWESTPVTENDKILIISATKGG